MNRPLLDIASSRIPTLPANKIQAGIRELKWCKEELEGFDVMSVSDRNDPRITALEHAIDEALLALFDRDSPEFHRFRRSSLVDNACFSLAYPTPIHEIRDGLRSGMKDEIERLDEVVGALKQGLEIIGANTKTAAPKPSRLRALTKLMERSFATDTAPPPPQANRSPAPSASSAEKEICIVASGNCKEQRNMVLDFLARVDLTPVPAGGSTGEASLSKLRAVKFAVVLLTPDDIRTINDPQSSPDFRPGPAQDVLFQLGFLLGAIGPDKVCALLIEEAEVDLGLSEFRITPMDRSEGWKLELAKKIKSAAVPIDLNRAF